MYRLRYCSAFYEGLLQAAAVHFRDHGVLHPASRRPASRNCLRLRVLGVEFLESWQRLAAALRGRLALWQQTLLAKVILSVLPFEASALLLL